MKTAGIVCEYNPLHNGHLYQINKTRLSGATHIVCAMSGNFVQRGEPAFLDKWTRAQIAVKSGADLVVEIPVPWAVSGAESFARGSVTLLNNLGIDVLSFGCETDDEKKLLKAAETSKDEKVVSKLKAYTKSGLSYPLALQKAAAELYGKEIGDLFNYRLFITEGAQLNIL